MTWKSVAVIAVIEIVVLTSCGTSDSMGSREFSDQSSALEHFIKHRSEFENLANRWLATGNTSFCTFGTDHLSWGEYYLDGDSLHWTIRYPMKDDWAKHSFQTEDEAAREAKTSEKEVRDWQRQLLAVHAECVETVQIRYRGQIGHFVRVAMPPPLREYGFRFAPEGDPVAHDALARWATIPPPPGLTSMTAIGSGWFYYEGFGNYLHPPFSQVSGVVIYANGQPAANIAIRLERAFGFSADRTSTDQSGGFRVTWVPEGRYRLVAEVFDPSFRSVNNWYYPGLSDSERATDLVVKEEEALNVGTWTIPIGRPLEEQ